MSETVTLTLAYPLRAEQAERVLAKEVKDYQTGDKITVRADYALSIINAGYAAGVDPADAVAVNRALGTDKPMVPSPATAADGGTVGDTAPVDEAKKTAKK